MGRPFSLGTPPRLDSSPRRAPVAYMLRLASRRLVTAALAVFAILYLVFSHSNLFFSKPYWNGEHRLARPYSVLLNSRPPSPFHPNARNHTFHSDAVKEWWKPWVTELIHSRPGLGEAKLKTSFGNHLPEDGTKVRPEPKRLVNLSDADFKSLQGPHERYVKYIQDYQNYDRDIRLFHHRGVVVVGGGEFFGPALVSIKMLRETGSVLPVEVFIPAWNEYEPFVCEDTLPALNARCVVLEEFLSDHISHGVRGLSHYQLKSAALLFSSFRDVLLIDSDSIPLVDPNTLFDSAAYVETGLVTWPDFWVSSETPDFWTKIAGFDSFPQGLPPSSTESGQLLLNKAKHFKTLMLALYYNFYGPKLYYTLLSQGATGEGDKTTYDTAAIVLKQKYYRVHTPPKQLGRYTGEKEKTSYRSTALVHFVPEANAKEHVTWGKEGWTPSTKPAFLHANTPKMNAGHLVDEGDLVDEAENPLRLLGSYEHAKDMFDGQDIEKKIWDHMVETGCALAGVLRDWRNREDMCARLEDHYKAVF